MAKFNPSNTASPDLEVDGGTLSVDADNDKVGIGTDSPKTKLTVEGTVTLKEQANAESDTAAYGQLWVKSDNPNNLYFTDDAGNDVQITSGGSLAAAGGTLAGLGSTDNAILRANGTGGETAQGSAIVLDDQGNLSSVGTIASQGISGSSTLQIVGAITSTGAVASSGSITAGTSLIIGSADINETDLEKIDGITNGTAAANKAVVVDGSKNIGTLGAVTLASVTGSKGRFDLANGNLLFTGSITGDGSGLSNVSATNISGSKGKFHTGNGNLIVTGTIIATGDTTIGGNVDIDGTLSCDDSITIDSVTITDTEIGYLDGLTLGTVAASKAVTADSNKDVGDFRHVTAASITGSKGRFDFANGNALLTGTLDVGGAVTIGGNVDIDGTLSCDDSLTIDSITITDTELGYLDGLTLGTVAASKVVTADSNKDVGDFRHVTAASVTGSKGRFDIANGNLLLTGTLDVGGATLIQGNTTFGVDDTGVDVRIFSATTNEGVLYDASEDELALLLTTKLKFHDVGGDEEIFASANGHLEVNAGTTLDMTAPTVDINASTAVTIDTDTLTVASANSTDPLVTIKNTTNDANGARLQFVKDKGAAGADGDDIGVIEFVGDDAGQTQTTFAKIVAEVSEADNTDEAGKLSFFVAESDGTNTALAAGLVLEGEHATDGEVDVTIGAGTASTTTIVGTSQFNANATFGVDDTGVDVRIFSATTNEGVLYDASEDELALLLTTKLKFHDVGGGEEIFASANGHLEINAGTTLDVTAPTVDINASTAVTIDTDTATFASSNANDPLVVIKNTTNDADGARLRFVKDKGAAGAANDVAGLIEFYADDANQDNILFAKVEAAVAVHTNGQEGGKLSLGVATHDGEFQNGLVLTDGSAEDEIDVTIGNGTSSVTTIAGVLDLGDRNITNVGDISLDSVSSDGSLVTINAPSEIANASDGGATALIIDNDDTDEIAVLIEAANIDADVLDISADAVTTANVIDITADGLTSGKALKIECTNNSLNGGNLIYAEYDGTSTNLQQIVKIVNDNASATKTIPLDIQQDSAHPAPAIRCNGPILNTMAFTSDNTDTDLTLTVAQLIDGTHLRGSDNGLTAHRTSTTPTAAQIVAAIPGCVAEQQFDFKLCNADATHNVILALGTGITQFGSGGYTLTPGQARSFRFRVTDIGGSSEAVTIIAWGPAYTFTA
jgi:hypothetical protein